jgi:hypothetical protein
MLAIKNTDRYTKPIEGWRFAAQFNNILSIIPRNCCPMVARAKDLGSMMGRGLATAGQPIKR